MLIFSLAMAFSIHQRLSLIFLGTVPFLLLGLYIMMKKAFPLFQRVFKIYDRLNNTVQGERQGHQGVKSFDARGAREARSSGSLG